MTNGWTTARHCKVLVPVVLRRRHCVGVQDGVFFQPSSPSSADAGPCCWGLVMPPLRKKPAAAAMSSATSKARARPVVPPARGSTSVRGSGRVVLPPTRSSGDARPQSPLRPPRAAASGSRRGRSAETGDRKGEGDRRSRSDRPRGRAGEDGGDEGSSQSPRRRRRRDEGGDVKLSDELAEAAGFSRGDLAHGRATAGRRDDSRERRRRPSPGTSTEEEEAVRAALKESTRPEYRGRRSGVSSWRCGQRSSFFWSTTPLFAASR